MYGGPRMVHISLVFSTQSGEKRKMSSHRLLMHLHTICQHQPPDNIHNIHSSHQWFPDWTAKKRVFFFFVFEILTMDSVWSGYSNPSRWDFITKAFLLLFFPTAFFRGRTHFSLIESCFIKTIALCRFNLVTAAICNFTKTAQIVSVVC